MAGPYPDETGWLVGQTDEDDDGGLIIRCRSRVPDAAARKGWEHLVIVGWTYEADETGMPLKAVDRQMDAFEEAVQPALQASGAGVLVASITGAGVREWRFYSIGPDAFMDALNTALDKHPEYPLEFEAFEDPDWNALAELLPE